MSDDSPKSRRAAGGRIEPEAPPAYLTDMIDRFEVMLETSREATELADRDRDRKLRDQIGAVNKRLVKIEANQTMANRVLRATRKDVGALAARLDELGDGFALHVERLDHLERRIDALEAREPPPRGAPRVAAKLRALAGGRRKK